MKKFRNIAIIILIIYIMLSLTSCRLSPVLQQIVYEQKSNDLDMNTETLHNDEDNSDENPDISAQVRSAKADRSNEREKKDAVEGDKESDADTVSSLTDNNNATQEGETSGGNNPEGEEEEGTEQELTDDRDEEEKEPDYEGETDETENPPDDTENQNGDDPEEGEKDGTPSSEDSKKQIEDDDGNVIEVPEHVNSITATGEAAVAVAMLGKIDTLIGTSESFTGNSLLNNIYGGSMDNISTWWGGDGSGQISEENFQQLLTEVPDVCVEISGQQTFSEAQVRQLEENGITYLVVPSLSTTKGISNTVTLLGKMFGGNAQAVSGNYTGWMQDTLNGIGERGVSRFAYQNIDFDNDYAVTQTEKTVSNASNEGLYTLYVSEWDDNVYCEVANIPPYINITEQGMAVVKTGYSGSPLNHYLSLAGIVNVGAIKRRDTAYYYVNPINTTVSAVNVIETTYIFEQGLYFTQLNFTHYLGEADGAYTKIVVANSYIRDKILESISVGGIWYSEKVSVSNDLITTDGQYGSEEMLIYSTIHGPFDIVVNPSGGIGSWTEGSLESPLEAIWAAYAFHDAYSLDEVHQKVSEFYNQFFGYNLSSSELTEIIGE